MPIKLCIKKSINVAVKDDIRKRERWGLMDGAVGSRVTPVMYTGVHKIGRWWSQRRNLRPNCIDTKSVLWQWCTWALCQCATCIVIIIVQKWHGRSSGLFQSVYRCRNSNAKIVWFLFERGENAITRYSLLTKSDKQRSKCYWPELLKYANLISNHEI